MSEETQEIQEKEDTSQEAVKEETSTSESQVSEQAPAATESSTEEKKAKKINRLSLSELTAKIEDMEKKNLSHSKYYKHLLQRKRELGTSV